MLTNFIVVKICVERTGRNLDLYLINNEEQQVDHDASILDEWKVDEFTQL